MANRVGKTRADENETETERESVESELKEGGS